MEFTKSEKKLALQVIEKGLKIEYANGLKLAEGIIQDWNNGKNDNREAYHTLYKTIIDFDKHIARQYDNKGGASYLWMIVRQLRDNIINEEDLAAFSPTTRQAIIDLSKL